MAEISSKQFGLLIAYILPGFIGLAGLAPLIPTVEVWLQPFHRGGLGIGAPLYAAMAAIAVGMIQSVFRWLIIDGLLRLTGIVPPNWNDAQLDDRLEAFHYLVENHYRYYQFYANSLIALLWVYPLHRWLRTSPLLGIGTDLGVCLVCLVLFAGSRDTLAKYYARTSRLIGTVAEKGSKGSSMTNGNHHAQEAGAYEAPDATETRLDKKPERKAEAVTKPEQPKAKPTSVK